MTGSYFRGDAEAVLAPQDEAKFDDVHLHLLQQLNGYDYLKQLDIGYFFYDGPLRRRHEGARSDQKTIVHIPSVNSRESTKDKINEVERDHGRARELGGQRPDHRLPFRQAADGRRLKDRRSGRRRAGASTTKVLAALKDPAQKNNRDYVDIIIALGMAKEGFDWIWCEHALTVGYRSSLTEIVQIIGRATRDAPGKTPRALHQPDRRAGCRENSSARP